MSGWIDSLAKLAAAGEAGVLVTVVATQGSTPREAGTKMVVSATQCSGTIGGGHLEFAALSIARALLAQAAAGGEAAPVLRDFALGPSLGQCCGGAATLLFEAILPARWQIALFGAGHVGRALVTVLAELPCRIRWIDARPEAFPAQLPANVTAEVAALPEDRVAGLAPGSDMLVMTHSHALDLRLVEAALRRRDLGYLGLIGSATKRARFVNRLAQRGLAAADIARLTCPIGIPGITGKQPGEIAIAVAAQLLARRDAARPPQALPTAAVMAGAEP